MRLTTTDKCRSHSQHYAMHISCPECHAGYHIEDLSEDAILVCHRCGKEFSVSASPVDKEFITEPELSEAEAPISAGTPISETEADESVFDEEPNEPSPGEHEFIPEFIRDNSISSEETEPLAPSPFPDLKSPQREYETSHDAENEIPRRTASIWPWLFGLLIIIAAAGFWVNKDSWIADPWLRSVMLNVGVPVQLQDSDWRVVPASVSAQWIKRDDGKHVLVIEGRVENLLQSEVAPPNIRLKLFATDDRNRLLREYTLPITQPPLLDAIRQAPFSAPPEDTVPLTALGSRGFILVLEDSPDEMGDFTLGPVAR